MEHDSTPSLFAPSPPLRAAMVRFTTLDPSRWRAVCASLAELGFDAVDLPLVWRDHERARPYEGRAGAKGSAESEAPEYDFTSRGLSVAAMCEAVHSAGLSLVLRLGPMATDDVPGLGVPDRVLDDRRCQARTRRQNPVLVPDPPGVVPLPSLASKAFRLHARGWIAAATRAVLDAADVRSITRVMLGPGPHALTRDDPYEFDHHPDGGDGLAGALPPHDAFDPSDPRALAAVERDVRAQTSFRDELAEELALAGLASVPVFVSVPGSVTVSPAAHALAERYGLCVACPPAIAGAASIWRQTRHAVALCARHGLHLEAWAGAPWYYPPTRGSHSVAAARVALAAGARDGTVRMGCAGGRWIGAVLAEDGAPRESTKRWRELLAWWGELPAGEEPGVELAVSAPRVRAARASTAVHPLPLGLLGLLGLGPEEIADPRARLPVSQNEAGEESARGESEALEEQLASYEGALWAVGVPCARVPTERAGALAPTESESAEALASRALTAMAAYAPVIDPPGSAFVRAVRGETHEHLFVVSRSESAARVTPPGERWEPAEPVALEPGSVQQFTRAAQARTESPGKG